MIEKKLQKRALSLDALRGFAILTMVLSGVIPFGVLPDWMYHAQVPPPTHIFNPNLPGITWVDLVFPFFLFSMGASFPLAFSRRIEDGASKFDLAYQSFKRGLLLAGFAIFDQHMRPYNFSSDPDFLTWLVSLGCFVLIFLCLVRFPSSLKKWVSYSLRVIGFSGAVLFLIFVQYPNGTGFSWFKSDIIILVLANVAFFGSLIWLITNKSILFRLSFLGILIAIRLAHLESGWVQSLWNATPFPWLYKLYYLQYLFIIIPGTIIGDIIVNWIKSDKEGSDHSWKINRLLFLVFLMFGTIIINVIGLKMRMVFETTVFSFIICIISWLSVQKTNNENENFIKKILNFGIFWLILGLFFEPYEGGIKKDHPTMSYYFLTTGLAIFMLIAFFIIIDIFKKKKYLQLLIDNGQNPMIAYAGVTNLIPPLLGITFLDHVLQDLTPTPWLGALRGLFVTFLLALCVRYFTKKKLFLRT